MFTFLCYTALLGVIKKKISTKSLRGFESLVESLELDWGTSAPYQAAIRAVCQLVGRGEIAQAREIAADPDIAAPGKVAAAVADLVSGRHMAELSAEDRLHYEVYLRRYTNGTRYGQRDCEATVMRVASPAYDMAQRLAARDRQKVLSVLTQPPGGR
jgi:hypothetical protein